MAGAVAVVVLEDMYTGTYVNTMYTVISPCRDLPDTGRVIYILCLHTAVRNRVSPSTAITLELQHNKAIKSIGIIVSGKTPPMYVQYIQTTNSAVF